MQQPPRDAAFTIAGQDPNYVAYQRRDLPFTFTGSAAEYFRIWIVNTLLTIVTLGIYSAWAKVRKQQYFYRHTFVEGSSFDYHAKPLSILKGRIVVGAVLGVVFAVQRYSVPLYVALVLVLVLLTPWVLVQSLAFNARNSSFRNVRFAFVGRVGEAFKIYLLTTLVALVTCGLGYPYAQYRLTEFVVRGHRFGDRPFHFQASLGDFFRIYLVTLALSLPAYGLMVAAVVVTHFDKQAAPFVMVPMFLLAYVYLLVPAAYMRAEFANLLYGRLHVGEHAFTCRQRVMELVRLYVTNALAVIGTLGLLIPWAQIRLARYRAERLTLHASGLLEVQAVAGRDSSALADAATDLGDYDLGLGV